MPAALDVATSNTPAMGVTDGVDTGAEVRGQGGDAFEQPVLARVITLTGGGSGTGGPGIGAAMCRRLPREGARACHA